MIESLSSYWRGAVFRSRTEARWAVFFDAIGLRWEYEPEGFKLHDGTWYLPDFWLPDMAMWAEVKPDAGPTESEKAKMAMLVRGTGYPCLALSGAPWPKAYEVAEAVDLPEAVIWSLSHFSDEYTVDRADGAPRLFGGSTEHEAESEPVVAGAMKTARSVSLTEPEADAYLPLGMNDAEVPW